MITHAYKQNNRPKGFKGVYEPIANQLLEFCGRWFVITMSSDVDKVQAREQGYIDVHKDIFDEPTSLIACRIALAWGMHAKDYVGNGFNFYKTKPLTKETNQDIGEFAGEFLARYGYDISPIQEHYKNNDMIFMLTYIENGYQKELDAQENRASSSHRPG